MIAERLRVYRAENAPLAGHYESRGLLVDYKVRHGLGDIEQLKRSISELLVVME